MSWERAFGLAGTTRTRNAHRSSHHCLGWSALSADLLLEDRTGSCEPSLSRRARLGGYGAA